MKTAGVYELLGQPSYLLISSFFSNILSEHFGPVEDEEKGCGLGASPKKNWVKLVRFRTKIHHLTH